MRRHRHPAPARPAPHRRPPKERPAPYVRSLEPLEPATSRCGATGMPYGDAHPAASPIPSDAPAQAVTRTCVRPASPQELTPRKARRGAAGPATLEHRSGLLGLAGTADMREVVAAAEDGDGDARLALDVYLHRLRAGVGAMAATLGGLDALVFTGGVGENAPTVRRLAVKGLGFPRASAGPGAQPVARGRRRDRRRRRHLEAAAGRRPRGPPDRGRGAPGAVGGRLRPAGRLRTARRRAPDAGRG
jgi:hypothetical protein